MSILFLIFFVFFKQKTASVLRISDWSSDVCSSDRPVLQGGGRDTVQPAAGAARAAGQVRSHLRRRRRAPAFAEVEHVLRRREGLLGPDGFLAAPANGERPA